MMNRENKIWDYANFQSSLDLIYKISNIIVATCGYCDPIVGCVFRLTLSLADVVSRLIFCWGDYSRVLQGEPKTTFILNAQVVCSCVLSY